jgi:hypothetical protein
VVIGTDKGVRFAAADADGNLTLGALIETPQPVLCAEGQGRFVWFGLTQFPFDTTFSGLGRLDLSQFTADLTPAYATDLGSLVTGAVQSVATYNVTSGAYASGARTVYTQSGFGIAMETGSPSVNGYLYMSRAAFGIPDQKTPIALDLAHDPLESGDSITVHVITDQGTEVSAGVSNTVGAVRKRLTLPLTRGDDFQIKVTLAGVPILRRVTLLATTHPDRTYLIRVPLLLKSTVTNGAGEQAFDVAARRAELMALFASGEVVTFAAGDQTWTVQVDDFQFPPEDPSTVPGDWEGTYTAMLKVLA